MNKFTCFCSLSNNTKKSLSNGNGSTLDRKWTDINPAMPQRLLSFIFFLLLIGVSNVWATGPKTSDLNFGTPVVSATFESESVKSVDNNTSSAVTNSSLSGYGPFTVSYLGKNDHGIPSIAIVDGSSDGDDPMTNKYFAITSTNNGASVSSVYTNATGKGAFSFKITKTSKLTIGLHNGAANGSFAHENAVAYLQFDGGSNIKISAGRKDGSPQKWDQVVSSSLPSTDILEIAVVYNTTNSSTTYGGSISLAAKSAHVYINGTAADDGEGNAKDFYIGSNTIANFRLFDNTTSRKTSCVDDIMIYSALPTEGSMHVTYNANGATGGTVPTDATDYTSGSTVTVKANTGSLVRTGCTFSGWNTAADGSGTDYAASGSATFTITANTTLYAKWAATVTWNDNGGTIRTDNIFVSADGKSVTPPSDPSTSARGNCGDKFMGWTKISGYQDDDDAPGDLVNGAQTITGSADYYAVFADKKAVTP